MKYKYTMIMKLATAGELFERVKVSVIAISATEAMDLAKDLVHNDFELVFEEYVAIEVI